VQFREKQKVKRLYGVLERQFKRYFDEASKVKEATGDALLKILESRLDNVVYRLHLAPARVIARQLVTHRHIMVNGRIVNVPSFGVKPGDVIIVSPRGMEIPYVRETIAEKNVIIPNWLNRKAAGGKVERLPQRDEIEGEISEQLIVEHYSR
jgi:small subunit ribosomal protein S4